MKSLTCAECEFGAYGESRFLRVTSENFSSDDLSVIAPEVVRQMTDGFGGFEGVVCLPPTKHELRLIFGVSSAIDAVLINLGLMPRHLPLEVFHVVGSEEFDKKISPQLNGVVKRGHAYVRRPDDEIAYLPSFLRCLCHEAVHLSAALEFRVEPSDDGGFDNVFIRDGMIMIRDGYSFLGLNEAVVERAADLICMAAQQMLSADNDMLAMYLMQAQPVEGSYDKQIRVVNAVCRHLFCKSGGMDGWMRLVEEHWTGGTTWLDRCKDEWRAAYDILEMMTENPWSADYALQYLQIK